MELEPKLLNVVASVAAVVGALLWPLLLWLDLPLANAGIAAASGASILGAAFLLSWAVEAAEGDVPPFVGLTVLALVALLPEYAVDATFAWRAATDPSAATYVIANMTGGNRLLLGLGWPLVALVGALVIGQRATPIPRSGMLALAALALGAAWAIVPATLGRLTLLDTAVYLGLYVIAMTAAVRAAGSSGDRAGDAGGALTAGVGRADAAGAAGRAEGAASPEDEDEDEDDGEAPPVGPAALIAALPRAPRWLAILTALGIASAGILLAAEPFAQSLIAIGRDTGVEEFVLVQWIAPIASEAPELVIAVLLALGGHPGRGLVLLITAKVNQWTLLVGTMPLLTSIAAAEPRWLPLDARQVGELGLTVAQTALGIALVASRSLGRAGAVVLLVLYVAQLALPSAELRWALTLIYVVLAGGTLLVSPSRRAGVVRLVVDLGRALAGRRGR